jgi:hypothetical protein
MTSPVAVRTVFPPDKIAINGKSPTGKPFRWAEDEKDTENTAGNIVISDEIPGGWKQISGVLARDPRKGYADLIPYSDMYVYIPGGRHVWEGSLDLIPDVSGEQQSINPGGVGYQSMLEDNKSVTVGFVTNELARWTAVSLERRQSWQSIGYNAEPGPSIQPSPDGISNPSIFITATGLVNKQTWNMMFDAGTGIRIYRLAFERLNINLSPALPELHEVVYAAETAQLESLETITEAKTEGLVGATIKGKRYIAFDNYYATSGGTVGIELGLRYRNLIVVGDIGATQPEHGVYPNLGFYSPQMISYLINNFTDLEADESKMDSERYIIQNAWYDTPQPAAAILKDLVKYEWMDWFVYQGKKLDYKKPGSYGKRWRTTLKESNLNETGIDGQRLWKSIVVQWTDPGSGAIFTAGPPGSRCSVTSSLLEITDPQHPAVLAKRTREDILVISVSVTSTTAVELGQRFLEESQLIDHSGSATLTGYVMDDKGVFYPVSCVKSGDYIEVTDSRGAGYRKIINKTYTHASRQSQIDLDAPATGLEELLERLNGSLVTAGVNN